MSDPRTGAQIQAHLNQMLKTVAELAEAMKLRQWAVKEAREALHSTSFPSASDAIAAHVDLSERLHAFALQPALEAVAAIESVKVG